MAETAFSSCGKYFSSLSHDGRLRIWDTETNILKQVYTPDLHLSAPPSCLQWITTSQSATTKKGQRKKSVSSEEETECIALGTTSGKILIYSVAQARIQTILEEKNELSKSKITSIDWHRKYGLYSCNNESGLIEWDLSNGEARNKYNVNVDSKSKQISAVSAIKLIPHTQKTQARYLITASTQIRVWRLHGSDAELIKCLGHSAAPKALLTVAELHNSCWLVEGSQNERLLSFWDVTITTDHLPQLNGEDSTPNRKKRKKSTTTAITVPNPTYNFILEDAPKQIDVDVRTEENGTKLSLAAVTRSGVVHYYGHMLNGASMKPIRPSVTVQVTTVDAQPLPLQCCRLPTGGDLVLGYAKQAALVFERVTPDLKSKTQVLIRGEGKQPKSKKSKQSETNKVREGTSNDVTYVEPMGGVSRKRVTPGATVEVPMEQRLANLTVGLESRGQTAVSHNLTKLLMQGLHSKDKGMILTVLQHNQPKVALHTVAALPADYVPQLLQQLADMAARKTSQCASVCTWLSALVRSHAALLLASVHADTHARLTHLLAIFTHRRSHLCQLLNLKGRLELTMSQRVHKTDAEVLTQEPMLNYHDSSSDEDMEIERAASDSVHSWGADSDSDREREGGANNAGDSGSGSDDSDDSGD